MPAMRAFSVILSERLENNYYVQYDQQSDRTKTLSKQ